MSKQKVGNALLEGYFPPMFPRSLRELRKAQEEAGIRIGASLRMVASRIPGFVRMDCPTTSDGYNWFAALYFNLNGTEVAILFPWKKDLAAVDGNTSDRSIAVYTRGKRSKKIVLWLIKQLRERILAFQEDDRWR